MGSQLEDCEKNSYPSMGFAQKVARKRMHDNRTLILRPYLCKRCGHWHLTHQPDRFRSEPEEE